MEIISVAEAGLEETADLLNRGYSDYFMTIEVDVAGLQQMLIHDGVDVYRSRVIRREGQGVGMALIARRGWTSRLAAMAIVPEARGEGVGRTLLTQLIEEAAARGERQMVLEVIEENTPAVILYERSGFDFVRSLYSYEANGPEEGEPVELEEMDLLEMARLVTCHGLPDLPWQISGETLAQLGPPNRAFRLGRACAAVTSTDGPVVGLRSILVEPEARQRGQALRLLEALRLTFPGKRWQVPALCPAEFDALFAKAGFKRGRFSQYQMAITLEGQ